jgi:translation initiation factor IF-2
VAKVRVYELAKELGLESKVLLTKIQDLGEFVKSASSTLEPPVVRKMRELYPSVNPPADEAPAKKAPAKKAAAPAEKAAPPAKKVPAKKAAPAAKPATAAKTTLSPQAAWPFPTGNKP